MHGVRPAVAEQANVPFRCDHKLLLTAPSDAHLSLSIEFRRDRSVPTSVSDSDSLSDTSCLSN
ncbi:hypothetical protein GCM10010264_21690 [Streptomyces globisporus]|nr:hypothetical protein GCM10010264_21690 [Streptomyces globisporus]